MKNILYGFVLCLLLIAFVSCKKERQAPVQPEPDEIIKEIVSFKLDGHAIVLENHFGVGIGNRAINVKEFTSKQSNGKLAMQTGNRYWYGDKDSISYLILFDFRGNQGEHVNICFSKKFKDTELSLRHPLLAPKDHHDILKKGMFDFAVDLERANTQQGVIVEFYPPRSNEKFTTGLPAFPGSVSLFPGQNMQQGSKFEILKVEKVREDAYLIEAQFNFRLYDRNGKSSEVKDGILRMVTTMLPIG